MSSNDSPLHELSPGVYEADYKVPKNANVTGDSILGRLVAKDKTEAPLIQAAQPITIDNAAPNISSENPEPGASVTTASPQIYALLDDAGGVGVNGKSARVTLDGQDVTQGATVTAKFVTFAPRVPLADGPHSVRLTVSDYVGNVAERDWNFTSNARQGLVTGFESDQTGPVTLEAGQGLNLTLHAQPGGKASYSLGNVAKNLPLTETSPGVYAGRYVPQPGSNVENAPVVAQFRSRDGAAVSTNLAQSVSIQAGAPRAPTITSPPDGVQVGGTVVIKGKAAPNSTVNVKIAYSSKSLGIFPVTGTAAQEQVKANPKGEWRTDELKLEAQALFTSRQNTVFTVSAVAVDATGQVSDPALIKITQE